MQKYANKMYDALENVSTRNGSHVEISVDVDEDNRRLCVRVSFHKFRRRQCEETTITQRIRASSSRIAWPRCANESGSNKYKTYFNDSASPSAETSVQFSHNTLAVLLCKSYYKCKIINIECVRVNDDSGDDDHSCARTTSANAFSFPEHHFASHALKRNDLGRTRKNVDDHLSPLSLSLAARMLIMVRREHKTISHSSTPTLSLSCVRASLSTAKRPIACADARNRRRGRTIVQWIYAVMANWAPQPNADAVAYGIFNWMRVCCFFRSLFFRFAVTCSSDVNGVSSVFSFSFSFFSLLLLCKWDWGRDDSQRAVIAFWWCTCVILIAIVQTHDASAMLSTNGNDDDDINATLLFEQQLYQITCIVFDWIEWKIVEKLMKMSAIKICHCSSIKCHRVQNRINNNLWCARGDGAMQCRDRTQSDLDWMQCN